MRSATTNHGTEQQPGCSGDPDDLPRVVADVCTAGVDSAPGSVRHVRASLLEPGFRLVQTGCDPVTPVGEIVGPGFTTDEIVGAIETVVETYRGIRSGPEETFIDTYRRIGPKPFKEALYGAD